MGYEVLLFVPVMIVTGLTVSRYAQKVWLKFFFLVLTFTAVGFFLFVWPSPLGLRENGIYWKGGNPELKLSFRSFLEGIGIVFVD